MAKRWAIANGNWSSSATWNDSLGVPSVGDEVWSNNFKVNLDQDISVMSLSQQVRANASRISAIPIMTGYTAPSGTCSASTENNTGTNAAWRGFDRTSNFWMTAAATPTGWLGYQFPTARIIKAYEFSTAVTAGIMPKSWTLEGSNNGSSWTVLDTQTNVTVAVSSSWVSSALANTTAYLYYRINISLNGGGTQVGINEFYLYDQNEYFSISAGGQFTAPGTQSITITGGTVGIVGTAGANNTALVNYSGGAGTTLTLNLSGSETWASTGNTQPWYFVVSNSGNLVVNGNVSNTSSAAGTGSSLFRLSTAGTVTVNGTIAISGTGQGYIIHATAGNATVVGDVNQISGANSSVINFNGNVLTVTGNVSSLGGATAIISTAAITVNITGNVSSAGAAATMTSSIASTFTIVGNITCTGTGNTVALTVANGLVIVSGILSNNATNGTMAIAANRVFISSASSYWGFKASGGGADRTLYASGVFPGTPSVGNVRSGVTFGPGSSLTGSLAVPSPSNVLSGVPTDNTVGTYATTPAAIASAVWGAARSSFTASGTFGETNQASPDNSSISAIKAKTDQLGFTSGNVNAIAQVVADKTGYALTSGERAAIAVAVEAALLNDGDGQALLAAIVSAIGNQNVDEIALIAAIRADLERSGGLIDTRATQTSVTAIKAKTDNLPSDPASESNVSSRLASSSYVVPPTAVQNRQEMDTNSTKLAHLDADISTRADQTSVDGVKANTDLIPATL